MVALYTLHKRSESSLELARFPFLTSGLANSSEMHFTVKRDDNYSVLIDILYPEGNSGELKQALLAGGNKSNEWGMDGVSFDTNVVVIDALSQIEIFRKYQQRPRIISHGSGHIRIKLTTHYLAVGSYKLEIQRIGSAESLANHDVAISVTKAYLGK